MKLTKKIGYTSLLFIVALILSVAVFGIISAASDTPIEDKGEIDVYLIAGQSNAAGSGTGKGTVDFSQINNVFYYGTANDNVFNEITPVAYGQGISNDKSGAEIGIADAVKDNGRTSIIVKYAIGATGIYPSDKESGTWTPPSYIEAEMIETDGTKIGLLYNNYITTVRNAVAEMKAQGYTPVLRGMWWMQGCDESNAWGGASIYDKLLGYLVDDSRRDIGEIFGCDASNMPFVCGAIHYNPSVGDAPRYIDTINGAQETVKGIKPCIGIVKTEGLERTDYWHLSGAAQQYVGARFIETLNALSTKQYVAYEKADGVEMSGVGEYAAGSSVTVSFTTLGQYEINKVYMREYGKNAVDVTAAIVDGVYTFTMPENEVFFSVKAEDAAADFIEGYASVPSYYPESEYPFVTFKFGKFYRAYKSWGEVLHMDNVSYLGSESGNITLYLRKDYTTVSGDNSQMVYGIEGKLIFDLGGHTITRSGGNLFQLMAKNSEGVTDITVKNGHIASQWGCPFYIVTNGSASAGHNFKITAEDMHFYITNDQNISCLVMETGNGGTDFDPIVEAVFNNCTYDLRTNAPKKAITLFNLAEAGGYQKTASVRVNGGKIIADTMDGVTVYTMGDGDSFICGKHEDKYLSLELPSSVAKPSEIFEGENGTFLEFDSGIASDDNTVYTLTKSNVVVTEYGVIPAEYSNADIYPFVVFYRDPKTNQITCVGYTHWADESNGSSSNPYGALVGAKDKAWCSGGATILLRRNYTIQTGYYANLSHTNGTIYLDLNDNTLTTSSSSALFVAVKKSAHNSNIKVKNGTILLNNLLLALGQADNGVGYVVDVSFENVSVGLAAGNNVSKIVETYTNALSPGKVIESNLRFTNCDFDFKTNAPVNKITFISLTGDPDCNKTNVMFEGGSVKAGEKGISFLVLDNSSRTNAPDSFVFLPYEKAYTTLTLASSGSAPSNWFDSEKGDVKFYALSTDGTDTLYTLDNLMTPYGEIPAEYRDAETYPFILFLDGKFLSAEHYWLYRPDGSDGSAAGALIKARQEAWGNRVITVLMRRNYQIQSNSTDKWMAHANATVNIDLNGFTITTGDSALLTDYANFNTTRSYVYNVYNGTVLLGKGALVKVFSYSGNSGRLGEINFTNVNVGFAANTKQSTVILVGDSTYPNSLNTWNISFTDCNFDLATNAPEYVTFIDATLSDTNHYANITVNGGSFKVNDASKFTMAKLIKGYDTLTFAKYDGSYTALELPKGAAVLKDFYAMGSDTYSFGYTSGTETADFYVLGKDVYIEGYGRVPFNYADENVYPFVLFTNGEFYSAEKYWLHRTDGTDATAEGAMITARQEAWRGIKVVMRRNYQIMTGQDKWISHANGTVDIDLGGYILTTGNASLFIEYANWNNSRRYVYNVFNGTILIGGGALMEAYSWTDSFTGRNSELNFTNVNIGFAEGSKKNALITSPKYDSNVLNINNLSFTNCNFDFVTNAPENLTFIDTTASGTNHKFVIKINGGTMKLSDGSEFTMAKLTEGYDSLTFGKYDGVYTVLTLPKGATALTEVFNTEDGSDYTFQRVSGNDEISVYNLKTNKFRISTAFLNLTSDINVYFRAYLPAGYEPSYMEFVFKGNTYTVEEYFIDENGLYCFAFKDIAPQYMGEVIEATLYATKDGNDYSVSSSCSILAYCKALLASHASNNALVTLVSDLLVYGAKAQVYAGSTDALVTEGLELKASTFNALDESVDKISISGDKSDAVAWKSIGLYLENDMSLKFGFTAVSTEGLTVEITVNGNTTVIDASEFTNVNGVYFIYFDGILATDFDENVTAVFKLNGEQIGQTLVCSADSYVYRMQNNADAVTKELVRALYNYGKSAGSYIG